MTYLTFFGSEVTMCTFDSGQLEIMIDAFWSVDGVVCPRDGAEIEPHLYPQREGYLLVLACPLRHKSTGHPLFRSKTSRVPHVDAARTGVA